MSSIAVRYIDLYTGAHNSETMRLRDLHYFLEDEINGNCLPAQPVKREPQGSFFIHFFIKNIQCINIHQKCIFMHWARPLPSAAAVFYFNTLKR